MPGPGSRNQNAEDLTSPYLIALQAEVKRLYSANTSLRVKACVEIGHIVYHGGETLDTALVADPRIIDGLLAIFTSERTQPIPVVVAALRTLNVMVRGSAALIESLDSRGLLAILLERISHVDDEVRIYTCSCLYLYMLRTIDRHAQHFATAEVQAHLRKAALDDWSSYQYNDAEELLKLFEIKYDPYLVSGCIQSRAMTQAAKAAGGQASPPPIESESDLRP
ncbi:hypothetical protein H9P43_003306 [Blastocladiella emersonii ATCC 22665]|nr:hypothetical protein H9P43_003306 [Blastocladiella emersonii ATCC 22665]